MMTAEEFIQQMPPGRAIYCQRRMINEDDWQVAFLLKETSERIQAMPKGGNVHVKAGLMEVGPVIVVVVMMAVEQGRFGSELYEMWWNAHQPDGMSLEVWMLMTHQSHLRFWWYGDRGSVERVIEVESTLQAFFIYALQKIRARPSWTMAAFDDARRSVEVRYSSLPSLWEALVIEGKEQVVWIN